MSVEVNTGHKADGIESGFLELWQPDELATSPGRPEEILLAQQLITVQQLEEGLRQHRDKPHLSLIEIFVESKIIDEVRAFQAVAAAANVPFVRVSPSSVEQGLLELVPFDLLKSKGVIPIYREEDKIVVGMSDPTDIFLLDDLRQRLNCRIKPVVAPPSEIKAVLAELSDTGADQVEAIVKGIREDAVEVHEAETEEVAADLRKVAGESPVIRYVNYLISCAVRQNASDIHIEPGENCLYIRYRVDGVLGEQPAPPLSMHAAVVSRLKIMASLDIAERRLPQDGRIHVTVEGHRMDLRVSTMPTTHGEKCVIRILDNRSILVGLGGLGMHEDTIGSFRKQVLQPHGIILVTGPTGSGKSTTLYSALQVMDATTRNICTVEDPVEYYLPHVTQIHVNEEIGLTFPVALRSLLRQDPDTIMVGEIRDAETARVAIQASLTGHLVLSTLHTNDAPSSITRLVDIGVEPYLIAAAVNAVLAQRLVRRICTHCKRPVTEVNESVQSLFEKSRAEIGQLYVGEGCDKCRQTGYKGRLGIYSLLILDQDLRDLISRNPSLGELQRAAKDSGMRDLAQDGIEKLAAGLTTAEEVMSITAM